MASRRAIPAVFLVLATASRALTTLSAIAVLDGGHVLVLDPLTAARGGTPLALLHHGAGAGERPHRHGLGDRLLVAGDAHHDGSSHRISVVTGDEAVPSRFAARAPAAPFAGLAGVVAGRFLPSSPDAHGRRPGPPPVRGPTSVSRRTTVLLI